MFYFINLNSISTIDKDILIEKLIEIGYKETTLNDISFCPYLIIHKDFENNSDLIYENINEGFLNKLILEKKIEEVKDSFDFISAARSLSPEIETMNGLF
jgi:hypothetical protein